jgi:hypothetical protein
MAATITTARPGAIRPSPLLRLAFMADAAGSGAVGLLMLAGGAALSPPLGLPSALLQAAGAICLGWGALMFWMGRRDALPAWSVWAVVGLNLVWATDSVLLLASGWVAPTGFGTAFVLAQAAAVLGFTALQWAGLRRSQG